MSVTSASAKVCASCASPLPVRNGILPKFFSRFEFRKASEHNVKAHTADGTGTTNVVTVSGHVHKLRISKAHRFPVRDHAVQNLPNSHEDEFSLHLTPQRAQWPWRPALRVLVGLLIVGGTRLFARHVEAAPINPPAKFYAREPGSNYHTRRFVPGDYFLSTLTFHIHTPTGREIDGYGTCRNIVRSVTLNGQACLARVQTLSFTLTRGAPTRTTTRTTTEYFVQNDAGKFLELATDDGPSHMTEVLRHPVVTDPGDWQIIPRLNYALSFTDGRTDQVRMSATGPFAFDLPSGKHSLYWSVQQYQSSGTFNHVIHDTYCPAIGTAITEHVQSTDRDGFAIDTRATLSTYELANGEQ